MSTGDTGTALASRLLPVPASATRYTSGDFARQVLTADQLAGEFWRGDPLGRARLTARFRIAAQVNWYEPSGGVTLIWLVQFATATTRAASRSCSSRRHI